MNTTKLSLYARPGGGHIHTSKECPMLEGPQFEHYKYREISIEEAKKRDLLVCPCVHKTFGSHHRLTLPNIKVLAKRLGYEL